MNRIEVPLYGNTKLVAEINTDPDYREIIVGIEWDGSWMQDLAVVREEYRWDEVHGVSRYVPVHDKYEVLVYGDCDSEDWTDSFQIDGYKEEK